MQIKQIITRVDDEIHKQLKILTATQETTVQKIIEEFLKNYVKEHNK